MVIMAVISYFFADYIFTNIIFGPTDPSFVTYRFFCDASHYLGFADSICVTEMPFIIQNSQQRHTIAIQLKLDEIIRATKGAHNALMDLEELEEAHLNQFRDRYEALAQSARTRLAQGLLDTDTPEA